MAKGNPQESQYYMMSQTQPIFPVTHSILSAQALLAEVSSQYACGPFVACTLLKSKLNDTYLLRTEHDRYILRVYRAHWRSLSAIQYELDLLLHLAKKGRGVSFPLARTDGALLGTVYAPEGIRHLALFTYAPGKPFYGEAMLANSRWLGQVIAELHLAAADFTSTHERTPLDVESLLDSPLEALRPLLAHRTQDWEYLVHLAAALRENLTTCIAQGLSRGICHGDLISVNAHMTDNDEVTFFDFDCCGPGWIAYDLSHIRALVTMVQKDQRTWDAFLQGYTDKKMVTEADLAAVALFIPISNIWSMGLHAANGADWGIGWMNDEYFDQQFHVLRTWEVEQRAAR